MKRLRTCVIGVGRVGAEHARLLAALPSSELLGVSDTDSERGEAVAEKNGCLHEPAAERLLDDADAAIVAVPTSQHAEVARAALEAGCHVLVEKPLAATLEEADSLIELTDTCGLHLCVGHVERYNGVVRGATPHLRAPRFLEVLRLAPFVQRATDVTVVLDLMIHDIDLVLGLAGSPVARLSAVGIPVLTGEVDIANARLELQNGAVANITASRVSGEQVRRLRIFQPSGYLSLDLGLGKGEFLRRRVDGKGEENRDRNGEGRIPPGLERIIERVPIRVDDREPLALELDAFLELVGGGGGAVVTAREGREALAVALEISSEIDRFVRQEGGDRCLC